MAVPSFTFITKEPPNSSKSNIVPRQHCPTRSKRPFHGLNSRIRTKERCPPALALPVGTPHTHGLPSPISHRAFRLVANTSSSFRLQREGRPPQRNPQACRSWRENAGPAGEQRSQIMPVSSGTSLPECCACSFLCVHSAQRRDQAPGCKPHGHPCWGPGSLCNSATLPAL